MKTTITQTEYEEYTSILSPRIKDVISKKDIENALEKMVNFGHEHNALTVNYEVHHAGNVYGLEVSRKRASDKFKFDSSMGGTYEADKPSNGMTGHTEHGSFSFTPNHPAFN